MAFGEPKQSPGYRQQDISALARQIKADLKKFGMNQRELATASGIPEARLSRILRGGKVRLTERDINQIALGLKKSTAERDKMRYLAWPELYEIDEALRRRDGCVFRVNCELVEQGIPLLGSNYEE